MGLRKQALPDRIYTCVICGRDSATICLCERCYERAQPEPRQDRPWYEPPSRAGRAQLDRRRFKMAQGFVIRATASAHAKQLDDTLQPNWFTRGHEWAEREQRRADRLAFWSKNWWRLCAIDDWQAMLGEQDEIRAWIEGGRDPYLTPKGAEYPNPALKLDASDERKAENTHIRTMRAHLTYQTPASELGFDDLVSIEQRTHEDRQTEYAQEVKANIRKEVFNKALELDEENFAALQVHLHHLRSKRDRLNSMPLYTGAHAAAALTKMLGYPITKATYRKRVSRVIKRLFPNDTERLKKLVELHIL